MRHFIRRQGGSGRFKPPWLLFVFSLMVVGIFLNSVCSPIPSVDVGKAVSRNKIRPVPLETSAAYATTRKGTIPTQQHIAEERTGKVESHPVLHADKVDMQMKNGMWALPSLSYERLWHVSSLAHAVDDATTKFKKSYQVLSQLARKRYMESRGEARNELSHGFCACHDYSAGLNSVREKNWCAEEATEEMGGYHACVLHNVCVGSKTLAILQKEKVNIKSLQVRIGGEEHKFDVLSSDDTIGDSNVGTLLEAVASKPTAIFFSAAHALKQVGATVVGLSQLVRGECTHEDVSCVKFRPHTAFSLDGPIPVGSLPYRVLAALLDPKYGPSEKKDPQKEEFLVAEGQKAEEMRCFSKAIVPGMVDSVFLSSTDLSDFRSRVGRLVGSEEITDPEGGKKRPTKGEKTKKEKRSKSRSVVLSLGDRVKGGKDLAQWVRDCSRTLGVPFTLLSISSNTSSAEKEQVMKDADALISLDGVDMDYTMLMRKDSLVLQLNPFAYIDVAHKEMADALGVKYMSWSCSRVSCAGDSLRSLLEKETIPFNAKTGLFEFEGSSFRWPYWHFVPHACPQCADVFNQLPKEAKETIRGSDIVMSGHRQEIEAVLLEAFQQLKWILQDTALQATSKFLRDK